jgi:TatD DNase family protein
MIIDTHCHLTYPDFNRDRDEVLYRAEQMGVKAYVTVATTPAEWQLCLDLAEGRPTIRVALGVHPNEASLYTPQVKDDLKALAAKDPRVVAIGETGLDFFRDGAPKDLQYAAFYAQLEIAAALRKPFILHCRQAEREMLDVLKDFAKTNGPLHGVWHCFTATKEFAAEAIELGLYFGLGGIITYPKAADLREAIKILPEDRIVLETDCPFLPPQGWRGQRNEPAYLTKVVEVLAQTRETTAEAMKLKTFENAIRLFGTGLGV